MGTTKALAERAPITREMRVTLGNMMIKNITRVDSCDTRPEVGEVGEELGGAVPRLGKSGSAHRTFYTFSGLNGCKPDGRCPPRIGRKSNPARCKTP